MLRAGELKNFDCAKCTEELKKVRGCYDNDVKLVFRSGHILRKCPLLLIDTIDLFYLQQYFLLTSGFPVNDDSALFADYILLYKDVIGSNKVDMLLNAFGGDIWHKQM